MADLAVVLFSLAVGTLIGYSAGNAYRATSTTHRPQRSPRYPWS